MIYTDFLPPSQGVTQVYVSEQCLLPMPRIQQKKSQSYKTQKTVQFQNFTIFFYHCRNLGKQMFFGLFLCTCLGFVFKAVLCLKGFLMTQTLGISIYPSMKKERLQYSEKLVKLICHKTAAATN